MFTLQSQSLNLSLPLALPLVVPVVKEDTTSRRKNKMETRYVDVEVSTQYHSFSKEVAQTRFR